LNLNLFDNIIYANCGQYLGEGIAKCAALTSFTLNLRGTWISGIDVNYLGKGISKCVTLTSLNLTLSNIDLSKDRCRQLK